MVLKFSKMPEHNSSDRPDPGQRAFLKTVLLLGTGFPMEENELMYEAFKSQTQTFYIPVSPPIVEIMLYYCLSLHNVRFVRNILGRFVLGRNVRTPTFRHQMVERSHFQIRLQERGSDSLLSECK